MLCEDSVPTMVSLSFCVPNMSQGGWPLKSDLVYKKVYIVFNILRARKFCVDLRKLLIFILLVYLC